MLSGPKMIQLLEVGQPVVPPWTVDDPDQIIQTVVYQVVVTCFMVCRESRL